MKLLHRAALLAVLLLTLAACGRRLPDVEPVAVSGQIAISEPGDAFEEAALAASPGNGSELFNQMTNTGFACSTCHDANSTSRLVGPGMLGIAERAAERVEGQSAAEYLYNSILHPDDYIVEEYPAGVMPQTYEEVYSDDQIYDIVAYLLTLQPVDGEETASAEETSTAPQETATEEAAVEATDEPADTTDEVAAETTDEPADATDEVAAEATDEPVEASEPQVEPEVVAVEDLEIIEDQYSRLATFGLANLGETLFNSTDYDCAECHSLETGEPGENGPGLLGIPQVAAAKADGQISPQGYIFTAITNTDVHQYDSDLTDSQAYDLVAYLMQFNAEGDEVTFYPGQEYAVASGETGGSDVAISGEVDQALVDAVANASVENGQALFVSTEIGAPCSSCHLTTSDTLVGPGFSGLAERAAELAPSAEQYLYESITMPNAYVNEGYPAQVMPQNYGEVMTEEQIHDLIAYLLTIE